MIMYLNYMAAPGCKHVQSINIQESVNDKIIFNAVCRTFGKHPDTVLINNNVQKREYVIIRQVTMTLFITKLKMTLSAAGDFFGGKNHATTLHAIRTVRDLLDTDRKFREDVGHLFVGVTIPTKRKHSKSMLNE